MQPSSPDYDNWIARVQDSIYNGMKINYIEKSIHEVGSERMLIQYAGPSKGVTKETNKKLINSFTVNDTSLDEVDSVILICKNDYYAFKIPTEVLREWELYENRDKNGYEVKIIWEDEALFPKVTKQDENFSMNIDKYLFNLKRDDEIVSQSVALNSMLYLNKNI